MARFFEPDETGGEKQVPEEVSSGRGESEVGGGKETAEPETRDASTEEETIKDKIKAAEEAAEAAIKEKGIDITRKVLVRHRTVEQIIEDQKEELRKNIIKRLAEEGKGRENDKKVIEEEFQKEASTLISPYRIPKYLKWLLPIVAGGATVFSPLAVTIGVPLNVIYPIDGILWASNAGILWAGLRTVKRPYEWVISCLGEFERIAYPGLTLIYPGLEEIVAKVKVNTDQSIQLYREEIKPVLLKFAIRVKPDVVIVINIKDPYAVVYNVQVSDAIVEVRRKAGTIYGPDERYFYTVEDILDSIVRSFLGTLDLETVIEFEAGKDGQFQPRVKKEIVEAIEKEADLVLQHYGVDVVRVLITQIEILDEDALEKLRERFKASQNEKIALLQEKVEKAQVLVEAQKALQREKQGKGEGSFFKEQIEPLKKQGLTSPEAANVITTKMWTDAAQKGANVKIVSMAQGGNVSMPLTAGIGMGIGQDISKDEQGGKKDKEGQETVITDESQKTSTGLMQGKQKKAADGSSSGKKTGKEKKYRRGD